jgi:Leucine-rich repeat (LRR) protein
MRRFIVYAMAWCCVGLLGRAAQCDESEEEARQAIERLGGSVETDPEDPDGWKVKLIFCDLKDSDLARVVGLKSITNLDIGGNGFTITAAGLGHLKGLEKLRRLEVGQEEWTNEAAQAIAQLDSLCYLKIDRIRDQHLETLSALDDLESLELMIPSFTVEGMKALPKFESLQTLEIYALQTGTDAAMQHIARCPKLETLLLRQVQVTDEGLKHLAKSKRLKLLSIDSESAGDAGLKALAKMKSLEELYAWPVGATDAGLKALERMKQLKRLGIHGPNLTNAGRQRLVESLPDCELTPYPHANQAQFDAWWVLQSYPPSADFTRDEGRAWRPVTGIMINSEEDADQWIDEVSTFTELTSLDLDGCELTDAGLNALGDLRELRYLALRETAITGKALEHLANLEHLGNLQLRGCTNIDDEALATLTGFPSLRYLDLSGTGVTDEGLEHLASLKGLEDLDLFATNVTADGVASLRQALPECSVSWDGE